MPEIVMPTLIREVEPELALAVPRSERIRFIRLGDADPFIAALQQGIPVGYVAGAQLDQPLRTLLNRILLAAPQAHLVVGLEDADPVPGVSPIVNEQIVLVAPLPAAAALVRATKAVWFEGQVEVIRRWVESGVDHWLVKKALHETLSERPSPDTHDHTEATVIRSLPDAAARCGADDDTLRSCGRQDGVEIAPFIAAFRAALAVRERFLGSRNGVTPWRTVACRCGYADQTGAGKLLKRELGTSLPGVGFKHLHMLLDRVEALVRTKP